MHIVAVHLYPLSIPLTEPLVIAIGSFPDLEGVLVRVELDDGCVGLGEAAPLPVVTGETQGTCMAIGRDLAEIVVGKDAGAIETRMAELDRFVPGHPSIKAAFDMALWDLRGKQARARVVDLLGGEGDPIETDQTISMGAPERMRDRALALREQGFSAVKVKIGGRDPDGDVRTIASIREVIGDGVALRLDANQGWDVPTAISVLTRLAPFDIQYCEQPVPYWDLDGLRHVRERSSVPIMADESVFTARDALAILRMGAADYLNIKLMKCGGITEGVRIATVARAAGVRCMVGCMVETRVSIGAAAHLASSQGAIAFADLDGFTDNRVDPVVDGVRSSPGRLDLPDGPGLGADIDPEFLAGLDAVTIRR